MKGRTWGPKATQESIYIYILPQEIPDSQEEVESDNEEIMNSVQWKKKVNATFNKQLKVVWAAIVSSVQVMVENMKSKDKGKKEGNLNTSKYAYNKVTKERFLEIVDLLEKGAESAGWKKEETIEEETKECVQKEPDPDFSWKAPWDLRKSWQVVEDIF